MDFLTLTLLLFICYGLYYYFKKKTSFFKDLGIPYAPGVPLLGALAAPILRRKHTTEVLLEIYNLYPTAKYVGTFDFNRPAILLRDPELIKSVTIKNFDNFPDHRAFFDDSIDPLMGSNLFNMTGERWKEARSLLSPAFTSSKMKAMFELMAACGKNFVDFIAEQPESFRSSIPTKDLFTKYTNDVIATCAFGITVDSLRDPSNDFYVLGRQATNLEGLNGVKFFLSRAVPSLMKLFNITFVTKKVADFFKNIVSGTISLRDEKGISRPDMIQLMMDARGKDNKYLKLDISEMTAQAFIFFFGGFDTTSTQMCVIAHELAINPDIQKKLQDEIDSVLEKTGGKPTYEAINGMLYLDAIFNESMRFHTQAVILDRVCTTSFELPPALPGCKPFTVKPGMSIWISPAGIHRDPNYYENPNVFDPDRYYSKKVSINDVSNMAFGIGPRSCIGNRFAILETKILFFFLLSKFTLVPNEKTCIPLKYSKKNLTLVAEGGFWLAMKSRETR